jgi:endonuclease/exonuclease/phosphatase family metal-dependent hydrolase
MKKILKGILYLILFVVVAFVSLILTAVVKDYQPEPTTLIYQNPSPTELTDTLEFTILSWNIGYCGLDKSMDFFYDGGKKVRPEKENVEKSLDGVLNYLQSHKDIDFYLLQEVDKNSKRSYNINQYDSIKAAFDKYQSFFGKNYDVFLVPTPPLEPYGKVLSGLMSLSKYETSEVVRYSFPGNYGFPKGLFMLDRCFLVTRFLLENGKELLIINTHNSAYDDGSLRKGQMDYLKNFLTEEFNKGNYIVVGGDWNQCPPRIKTNIPNYKFDNEDFSVIEEIYLPSNWKWVYSNSVPTNRRVMTPFDKKTSPTTVIDFFLISPNIESISIENFDLGFEFSDHHPVKAKFKLISENEEVVENDSIPIN